ncbi:MarR family transcriptional regulator [Paenibacillus sp. IB182496]|uniref:MarR family transcriptional regulator n=1 Tax=Paenibacillus sabuli TaxID=2772509 RepID=A0A927BU81_9BACL|nr:MarR family transcriptional regulator [Paenibacillus sabuli]MBD2845614.1 MarR family transcriptional regulator [Paenibacillus sabuli]
MRAELIDTLAEQFMIMLPLLQKKVFDTIGAEEVPRIKLTPAACRVLVLLQEHRSATVSVLSEQLNISRPNMTPLVDRLVRLGLAERRVCEHDRRAVDVSITGYGDEVCEQMQRVVSNKFKHMLSEFDNNDLTEMIEHMNKVRTILMKDHS